MIIATAPELSASALQPPIGALSHPESELIAPPVDPAAPRPPGDESAALEVDPLVIASLIEGRHDLLLRGRFIALRPIRHVVISHDGEVAHELRYGRFPHDGSLPMPQAPGVRQYGFACVVSLSASDVTRELALEVAIYGEDSRSGETRIDLTVQPGDPPVVTLRADASRPIADYADALPPIALHVERIVRHADNRIEALGWALARQPLVTVQLFAGDLRLGAARLSVVREDVQAAFPDYTDAGRSGFVFHGTLPDHVADVAALRVEAVAAKGLSHAVVVPLGAPVVAGAMPPRQTQPRLPIAPPEAAEPAADPAPAPLAEPAPADPVPLAAAHPGPAPVEAEDVAPETGQKRIRLMCDEATITPGGLLMVDGWCAGLSGIARVFVRRDGVELAEAEFGRPRPDVGRALRDYPDAARSGYLLRVRPDIAPAAGDAIEVVAEDTGGNRVTAMVALTAAEDAAAPDAAAAASDPETLKFNLDAPAVHDGVVIDPVTGRLVIEGWVLSRAGVEGIDVLVDDARVGSAYYGLARQDVGAAFASWPNALRSGFAFQIPSRVLKNGEHAVALHLRTQDGGVHVQAFRITVRKEADGGAHAGLRERLSRTEAMLLTRLLARLDPLPPVQVLIRATGWTDDPSARAALARTLASLLGQVAVAPEISILAPEEASGIDAVLAGFGAQAARVAVLGPRRRASLRFRAHDRVGVLAPGDWLAADALAELQLALADRPGADFIYCDEARFDPCAQERAPFYKPDWSPDLLAATNYIARFWLASGRLLRAAGVKADALAQAGDYDLVLRLTEQAAQVAHLPKLLVHREAATLDTPAAEQAALEAMRARRAMAGTTQPGRVPGTWRFTPAERARGLVSFIIPTCAAQGHIRACLTSLREKTLYRNFETVVIDNIPPAMTEWKEWLAATADRVVDVPEPFNWSRFNNLAVAQSRGDYLLFFNDDVEIIDGEWLDVLLDAIEQPGVGAVGARLLYPDGKLQHGGMFLADMSQARHAFRFLDREEGGYFGLALTQRNVISVTGACLLVKRSTFDALGGFDEAHDVINNDLDFNLRIGEAGLRVVYAPQATLIHHELASRAGMKDRFDTRVFERRWAHRFISGDPYFNPNLLTNEDGLTPSDEPLAAVFSSGPVIAYADVRRILAVKVDHIGDFITALPALRRLRRHFPQARLTVLASSAARAFLSLEPAIDEILVFNFFHAKSALGRREVTEAEIDELAETLRPYAFDIAIDLRKHLDTRKLLRASGARVLAGYDHMGQFPWLDIALEWEGDRNLQAKRYHITDNLVHLVDAVAAATEPPHAAIPAEILAAVDLAEVLTPPVQGLFERRVVCVHPGAGNELKQWPVDNFAQLLRLLIDRDDVGVVLIGGPDEAAMADDLQAAVDRPDRIASVAGRVGLGKLPAVMARCALYIGNDSGPKHIAAAVGLPTVGIHSGSVDAVEWAPSGPNALALHRATACSPCYIAAAELCPRQLACLTLITPIQVYEYCARLLALGAAPAAAPVIEVAVA